MNPFLRNGPPLLCSLILIFLGPSISAGNVSSLSIIFFIILLIAVIRFYYVYQSELNSFILSLVTAGFFIFNISGFYFILLDPYKIIIIHTFIFFLIILILLSIKVIMNDIRIYKKFKIKMDEFNSSDKIENEPVVSLSFYHIFFTLFFMGFIVYYYGFKISLIRLIIGNILFLYMFWFSERSESEFKSYHSDYSKTYYIPFFFTIIMIISYYSMMISSYLIINTNNYTVIRAIMYGISGSLILSLFLTCIRSIYNKEIVYDEYHYLSELVINFSIPVSLLTFISEDTMIKLLLDNNIYYYYFISWIFMLTVSIIIYSRKEDLIISLMRFKKFKST